MPGPGGHTELVVKVLLVSANRADAYMRALPLGLLSVASSVLPDGHAVQVLDLMETVDPFAALASAIAGFKPRVIGISLRNIDNQSMGRPRFFLEEDEQVIERAKTLSGATVVLGGAGFSIFPEAILARSSADMGIQGEGEQSFRLLLQRLEADQSLAGVPGLYVKGKGLQGERVFGKGLDRFPLPEAGLLLPGSGRMSDVCAPVQTRRGCPMGCSYCSTGEVEGTAVRKRSPDKLVKWITRLKDRGIEQFYFVDNTFNLPVTYAKTLCKELVRAGLGIKWRCIVYPYRMDDSLADLMASAGCVDASIGFESGCERILRSMNKRFLLKDVRQTCALLGRHAIRRMGFLLIGGPGETRESMEESLAFADSLNLESVKITLGIRVYPHTPLAEHARKEGLISADDDMLLPRFYVEPGLEGWAREATLSFAEKRPNWLVEV
jgi:radical SAM superfamily enzyme YgiQ (UPF0313 family)